ncbi:hypothetical protein DPMN_025899 [Dreissena polymorpha]|uniref:Uncharacterized protein n=1 Tax=Dreissena polymorpha TaxID=45954 RepID=A0A9D4LSD7_DREPO|nr:hypothetical protein DPMN_025899 [Dreissena polymorpha]
MQLYCNLFALYTRELNPMSTYKFDSSVFAFVLIDPDLEIVVRLGDSVANDVLNACNRSRDPLVLHFKLRPRQAVPQSENQSATIGNSANISDNENIVVHKTQLGTIFKCIGNHSCDQPSLDYNITDRKGLCVDIKVSCHNCDFCIDEIPLYTSIPQKHVNPLEVLSISLLLPVLCSKLGKSDLQACKPASIYRLQTRGACRGSLTLLLTKWKTWDDSN